MDISDTIAPRSDQLNADDLIAGPVTVTVERVEIRPGEDQPAHIHLIEYPGRPYKPSKTMRRLLSISWGKSEDGAYEGRRMTLYRNPEIKFSGVAVGGIEISHLSDIDRPVSAPLTASKGKKVVHRVDPLPDATPAPTTRPEPTAEQVAAATSPDVLRAMWQVSGPERRAQIQERVAEIGASDEPDTLPID